MSALRRKLAAVAMVVGLATAIASPDTLPAAAVHRSRSRPGWTPRSWEMKIDRNGKAKLKPKIAVNSANQSATRLRRQSTAGVNRSRSRPAPSNPSRLESKART